ncbi:MAG: calcium-binding protein, partial [Pseudomonadota bacterium]
MANDADVSEPGQAEAETNESVQPVIASDRDLQEANLELAQAETTEGEQKPDANKVAPNEPNADQLKDKFQELITQNPSAQNSGIPGLVIKKPTAGETNIVEVATSDGLAFDFNFDDVVVSLSDVDLILSFSDGSSIVLVGFGVDLFSESEINMNFVDTTVDKQAVISKIGVFEENETQQVFNASTASSSSEVETESEETSEEVVEEIVEAVEVNTSKISTASPFEGDVDAGKEEDAVDERSRIEDAIADEEVPPAPTQSSPGTPSTEDDVNPAIGESDVDIPVINVEVELFGISGVSSTTLSDGTTVIAGSAAIEQAETNDSFAVQQAREKINGTSGDDLIAADNPDLTPSGTAVRTIRFAAEIPAENLEPTEVLVGGLPEGYSVINGTKTSNGYIVNIDPNDPSIVEVDLQYVLPEEGATTDFNGFYSDFVIGLEYTFKNKVDGNESKGIAATRFAIRDVETEADTEYVDPVTDEPYYILNSTPPGNIINAGAGDDTVVAGAGEDTLSGGSGNDTASYETSSESVVSDLTNALTDGGYAEGDTLTGFENLIGSAHDDQLFGNNSSNVLEGGAGADLINGRLGTDTASYEGSSAGVNVDLGTGIHFGGDAGGDTLTSIENLQGSDFDDVLTGDSGNNTLSGGLGNDVLRGNAGADFLDGGAGTDTVDYAGSSAVDINLTANTASGGDANGDEFDNIENIIGSSNDDTLTGNLLDNELRGEAGDDVLSGIAGENRLFGGSGDDTIIGGAGRDLIDGGAGNNDSVEYSNSTEGVLVNLATGVGQGGDAQDDSFVGIENLTGSDFDDDLTGNSDVNVLTGGLGDDVLNGGAGADVLIGGVGSDAANYSTANAGVQINLSLDTASGSDASGDTFVSIENVIGSNFDDTITGDIEDNILLGGAGNDLFSGLGGADTISGGAGYDTVDYSLSTSFQVDLNISSEQFGGDAEGDILSGIEGVIGGSGDDVFVGNGLANTFTGGDGDDTASGGLGGDVLAGGLGSDTVEYQNSDAGINLFLDGTISSGGHAEGDVVTGFETAGGSEFDDIIVGAEFDETLLGRDGGDTLVGGGGADILDGGIGFDFASYQTSSEGVIVNLQTGITGLGGDETGDSFISIEGLHGSVHSDNLVASDSGSILDGNEGDDTLTGGTSDDIIFGGSGDDIISGEAGADTIDGGAGNDTVTYQTSLSSVTIDLSADFANDAAGGDAAGDDLANIENVIGTDFNDSLTGDATANILQGGVGDDRLVGLGGADTLIGGAGRDVADYSVSDAAVEVDLVAGTGDGGDSEGDTLFEVEDVIGSSQDDMLLGDANDNELIGGEGDDEIRGADGDDTLDGGAGNDVLEGGIGADAIDGGAGTDTVDYQASTAFVSVDLDLGVVSGGHANGDTLNSIENITATDFDDILIGNDDKNVLDGGAGNDLLVGGENADTLIGGDGIDTADYSGSAGNVIINLEAGTGSNGDAQGDILSQIENVVGSDLSDFIDGDFRDNRIEGGAGFDTLKGNEGDDIILGGTGDDTLSGGEGADTLDGGDGEDTVDYSDRNEAVTVNLDTGLNNASDTYISIENVKGTTNDDTLIGSDGANVIDGGLGNDTLAKAACGSGSFRICPS